VTAGECVGFGVPAAVGALLFALDAPQLAMVGPLVAAGAVEGAVLGAAQAHVLRDALPTLAPARWIRATAAAAAVAWACGMLPNAIADTAGWGTPAVIAMWIPAGVVILLSIGGAQALVLRDHIEGAGWWLPANIGAWMVGVSAVFAAMTLVDEESPAWAMGLVAAAGGLAMAAIVAAVTGWALTRLMARTPKAPT
jgi:hypothetical protein